MEWLAWLQSDPKSRSLTGGFVYRRAIVPIGVMFSLSLICGNLAYLYLSVSFIQMLKVRLNREFGFIAISVRSRILGSTQY